MRLLILSSLGVLALLLAGCAATTPPPRFGPVSPADADGPESAVPPPPATLATEPEALAVPPEAGHEAHPPPAGHQHSDHAPSTEGTRPAAGSYTCAMHPEVSEPEPGHCRKCGMALVKRVGEEAEQ